MVRTWRSIPNLAFVAGLLGTSLAVPSIARAQRSATPEQTPRQTQGAKADKPAHLSTLEGAVIDSLHGGGLADATVLLDGTQLSATTDENGRFRIDSIPPGDYRVAVFHPVLDTLGFSLATPPLRMGADSLRQLVMSTPSAATLVGKACSDPIYKRLGPSAIMGKVLDPDTHAPIDSANVSLVWTELEVGQSIGVKRSPRVRKAVTDADGNFTLCGIPAKVTGTLQAELNKAITAEVPVDMQGSPLLFEMLTLTPVAQGDSIMPTTGTATLTGRVTDQHGAPVPGARVTIQGSDRSTNTARDGRFHLTGLPSGTRGVMVRRIGFSPGGAAVNLAAATPATVDITLYKAAPTLDTVKVEGVLETALRKNGFTERRRMGMGHYIGPKDLERMQPQSFISLFQTLPGFNVNIGQFGSTISYRGNGCVTFYVDGIQQFNIQSGQLDNLVRPEQIMAIETYSNTSAPMQYRPPGQSCAIVLVWTNRTVQGATGQ